MDSWRVLSALFVLMLRGDLGWGQDSCNQCDCKLSSNEDERAIFNVRSSMCSSGSIEWSSAYGAVRLEVLPLRPGDYRLCFVVDSHHTVTQVSRETPHLRRKQNYRLRSLQEERSLTMSRLVSTSGKSEEVCVVGRTRHSVLLYIEVQRSNQFTGIPSLTLQYDVELLTASALADPMEECRPCTQDEMLDAYCTSDFVAVGSIDRTKQAEDNNDHMHMEVAVAQLIHQNSPVFSRVRRDDRYLRGTIHAPTKCSIRAGKGHFLFTGRMRLGKAKLRCAPYFEDWLKISSLAECVYD